MERTLSEYGVVSISHPQKNHEMAGAAAYLLVNKLNASFPFFSMSRRLASGSLNLVQQFSANASADSHWSVDLRPSAFFHSPVSSSYG